MSNYIPPKNDNKDIGSAMVGGAGQSVDAYDLSPANQDISLNSTAPPPAGDPPSVSPGSSPDSKSADSSSAFRPKGRITGPTAGKPKPKPVVTTATKPPPKS